MPWVNKTFFFPLLIKHHSAFVAPLSAIKVTGMSLNILLKYGLKLQSFFQNCYFARVYKVTETMRNKKLQVWLPLIFAVVMIAGMFFGFKLHQETGSANGFFKKDRTTSLQEALDIIKDRYVDKVGLDS